MSFLSWLRTAGVGVAVAHHSKLQTYLVMIDSMLAELKKNE